MSTRIIVVVYATEENKKCYYAKRTLYNILNTTNLNKHELFISDNGSNQEMLSYYDEFIEFFKKFGFPESNLTISLNGKNLGTSEAVNLGLRGRKEGQFIIKRDDDTIVEVNDWVEQMEEAMLKDKSLGILGLKRWDLEQHPEREDVWKSSIKMLPHERGERWITIEYADDIMGTCTIISPALLDKIGYFFQPTTYGFDDVIISIRSKMSGFKNGFLPHIPIQHIDEGDTEFTQWKRKHAGETMKEFQEIIEDYTIGVRELYYNPFKLNEPMVEAPKKNKAKFKLITTASDPNHKGWLEFKRSLDHFNWDYHLIVHEYTGFNSKIVAFYNYLLSIRHETKYFLYADSYDCFALSTQAEIEAKFTDWDSVTYGLERAIWPFGEWGKEFPESPYPHKYINGGLFMGSVERFIEIYERSPIIESGWDNDQIWAQDNFLRKNENGHIKLDRECKIFQCIAHLEPNDFLTFAYESNGERSDRILNLHTKTMPVVFHFNGHSDGTWVTNILP